LNYISFKKWADENHSALKLPADCRELQPQTTVIASSLVWTLTWYLQFGADRYVRIRERYDRIGGMIETSRRIQFAYHYGPIVKSGIDGLPLHQSNDPVDIRIDNVSAPAHLHFGAPNPHHDQSVVKGLHLEGLDMFAFVRGIMRHRATAQPLDKVFNFTIE
jgi:hypothetical protein